MAGYDNLLTSPASWFLRPVGEEPTRFTCLQQNIKASALKRKTVSNIFRHIPARNLIRLIELDN